MLFLSMLKSFLRDRSALIGDSPRSKKFLADFVAILKNIDVVLLIADDKSCAAELKLETIFGIIPFVERFQIVDGKIAHIRAYYDPRPILEYANRSAVESHLIN